MLARTLRVNASRAATFNAVRHASTESSNTKGSVDPLRTPPGYDHFDGKGPAHVQYNIFNPDPQFTVQKRSMGPFGTIDKPTKIYSPKPYRIVGCTGNHEHPHSVGWFVMEGYLKHMCPECGQMFQLTNNPDEFCTDFIEKVDPDAHIVANPSH